jgi:hypothetical protein
VLDERERMIMLGLTELLRRILRGYRNAAVRIAWVALFLVVAVAISALIVYPLWFLAGNHPQGFTYGVLGFLGLLLVLWIGSRLRRGLEREGSLTGLFRSVILPSLGRIAVAGLLVVTAYVLAVAYAQGVLAVAVPGTVLFAGALGYLLYLRGRGARNETR